LAGIVVALWLVSPCWFNALHLDVYILIGIAVVAVSIAPARSGPSPSARAHAPDLVADDGRAGARGDASHRDQQQCALGCPGRAVCHAARAPGP
jgi:hypothetical protein